MLSAGKLTVSGVKRLSSTVSRPLTRNFTSGRNDLQSFNEKSYKNDWNNRSSSSSSNATGFGWGKTALFGIPLLAAAPVAYDKMKNKDEKKIDDLVDASRSTSTKVADAAATAFQSRDPVRSVTTHLSGIRVAVNDKNQQVAVNYYLTRLSDDFAQGFLYDSDESDAKLIGVEYIISEKLYENLPSSEKQLWHPHSYEIANALLVAPDLPSRVEYKLVSELASSYSKTFFFWDSEHDPVPYGDAQFMSPITREGIVNEELLARRNKQYGIEPEFERKYRSSIKAPERQSNLWTRDNQRKSSEKKDKESSKDKKSKKQQQSDDDDEEETTLDVVKTKAVEYAHDLGGVAVVAGSALLGKAGELLKSAKHVVHDYTEEHGDEMKEAAINAKDKGVKKTAQAFQEDGIVGRQFTEKGAIGGLAQQIGGPFDKDGAIGKQFTADGAIGGTVQKVAEDKEEEKKSLSKSSSSSSKDVKNAARDAKDSAKEKYSDAKDYAKNKANEVKNKAENAKDNAKDNVKGAARDAKNKYEDVKESAKEKYSDAKDYAKNKANEVKDKAENAKDNVKGAARDVKNKAENAADDVKKSARDAKESAKESAGDAKKKTAQAFKDDGAIGKQFTEKGAIGGTAQKIGGPFDKEGAIGKQFTKDGAIGGAVQKKAEEKEDENKSSKSSKSSSSKDSSSSDLKKKASDAKDYAYEKEKEAESKLKSAKDTVVQKAGEYKDAAMKKGQELKNAAYEKEQELESKYFGSSKNNDKSREESSSKSSRDASPSRSQSSDPMMKKGTREGSLEKAGERGTGLEHKDMTSPAFKKLEEGKAAAQKKGEDVKNAASKKGEELKAAASKKGEELESKAKSTKDTLYQKGEEALESVQSKLKSAKDAVVGKASNATSSNSKPNVKDAMDKKGGYSTESATETKEKPTGVGRELNSTLGESMMSSIKGASDTSLLDAGRSLKDTVGSLTVPLAGFRPKGDKMQSAFDTLHGKDGEGLGQMAVTPEPSTRGVSAKGATDKESSSSSERFSPKADPARR